MANIFDHIGANATEHVVAESTKLRSTRMGGGHMANIQMLADADNGCLFSLGEYVSDEVYKGVAPVAGAPVYLIITPPLAYNSDRKFYADEKYFYNAKGEIARGYQIFADDFFTLSAKAFATSRIPVKNDYVSYSAATKLYTASTSKGASGFVGQITNVITRADGVHYEVKVVAPSIGSTIDATHTVTMTLTNLTSDAPAFVYADDTPSITLTATDGKVLPSSLTTITMGGNALTATTEYTYDATTGVIVIKKPTSGAIAITASGANAG